MAPTVRMRGNISKTSTGKYSGDVTVEFTDDLVNVDDMQRQLQMRIVRMADWMDAELKARGNVAFVVGE